MRYRARYDVQKQELVHVQFIQCRRSPRADVERGHNARAGRPYRPSKKESEMTEPYNGMPAEDLAVIWQKSSFSNPSGNCVEVAKVAGGGIAVRNSRDPHGPALVYTTAEISAFVQGAKGGEFDHLV